MSGTIQGWANVAFNHAPHSQNRIHSDDVARAYGFTGALVPGVTISAYLLHPAIETWGLDWLTRGSAQVQVLAPVYDERAFEVTTAPADAGYTAELTSEDRRCAVATVQLPTETPEPPAYRGHAVLYDDYTAPQATRSTMAALMDAGCLARRFRWNAQHDTARYLRDQRAMPALLRTDGEAGSGGFANPAMLLGCGNRHFASVARMSPWVHLETRSQNFAPVPLDTVLVSEMTILDLFSKKGHEFADCQFNLFRDDDKRCVFTVWQRAIYLMRPAG
jgi:hypothetical protein